MIPALNAFAQAKGAAGELDRDAVPRQIARHSSAMVPGCESGGPFWSKTMSEGAESARGVHWTNVITVLSAAILIGTEIIGAGMATGWAIAGLFGLGEIGAYVLEAIFVAAACVIIFNFVRRASKI